MPLPLGYLSVMASGASDASSTSPQGFTGLTPVGVGYRTCLSPWLDSVIYGAQSWIRTSDVSYVPDLQSGAFKSTRLICAFGGSGRIRTHEGFLPACFQDKCLKPDSATLPKRELYSVRVFVCAPRIGSRLIPCIAICVIQTTPRGGCYFRSPMEHLVGF